MAENTNKNEEIFDLIEAITRQEENNICTENLKSFIFSCTNDVIKEVVDSVYAIDIALVMEEFSDNEIVDFYAKIDNQHMALILEQSSEKLQRRIVNIFTLENVLKVFNFMSNDDIADILGSLRTDMRKNLLKLMRSVDNIELQKLLQYDHDTAGGIMTTEYISLRESLKASDALKKIKEIAPKTEIIETIFVVNDNKQLIGSADLRDIFTAKDDETLYDVMHDNIVTVTPDVDQEEVSSLVSKYDLKAIAVINRRGSLLGIITVDDIIDVLVEEQTEDILKLGGVYGDESVDSSVLKSIKIRLPWLLVNLITVFLASFVVSRFESVIAQVVALSAMMPIVAGSGGNAGSQTLAIIIRGITLGEINLRDDYKRVYKELIVGVCNSIVTGTVAGIITFVMYQNIYLSIIMCLAMILNSIVSSSFGFFIPLILKSLKLDPALASNIFLTTATDIMGFFILLALASNFLVYLV